MFNHVVLGGTFDHFHRGHRALINKAFEIGKRVTIGLTSEKLIKNKFLSQTIESYENRKKALKKYLDIKKCGDRTSILLLNDIFGSTLTDKTIEAIVVSKNTLSGAKLINKERKKRGLLSLEIIVIPDVLGEDGELITSERIRLGVIDREGHNFQFSIFNFQKKPLILPQELRERLRRPLGTVFPGLENQLEQTAKKAIEAIFKFPKKPVMVITVGDIISFSLKKIGFLPDVKIIDLRSRRKEIIDGSPKILPHPSRRVGLKHPVSENFGSPSFLKAVNNPGTLSPRVSQIFQKAVYDRLKTGSRQVIVIRGEEDLTTLPAILFAPLHSVVLYGQMGLGVVAVEVTEEKKGEVEAILQKFHQ